MGHLEITKIVRAPRKVVFDWWTDLTDTDSSYVEPLKIRRVLKREGDVTYVDDMVKILGRTMRYSVKVTVYHPDRWVAEYSGRIADATSTYKLIEIPEGTKILYSSEVRPKGILTKIAFPIIRWMVERVFSKEMDDYNGALEEDWRLTDRENL